MWVASTEPTAPFPSAFIVSPPLQNRLELPVRKPRAADYSRKREQKNTITRIVPVSLLRIREHQVKVILRLYSVKSGTPQSIRCQCRYACRTPPFTLVECYSSGNITIIPVWKTVHQAKFPERIHIAIFSGPVVPGPPIPCASSPLRSGSVMRDPCRTPVSNAACPSAM
jgi:hypothetical protein